MHPSLLLLPLFACSFLLLHDRASADCGEPATCGKLALRYPFWLGSINHTASPCGHPAFEVWCSDSHQSIASFRGSALHVHAINYTDNSFIASNARFAGDGGVCRTDLNMSITVTLTSYKISPRNRALCFLYDCSGTPPIGSEYVNATSNCSAPIYAYLGGTYSWGKPPEITVGRCSYSYIPVMGREAATMTAANYSQLLRDGFVMEWEAAGIGDCAACNASGGQCRYDNADAAFRCLCPDGRRTGSTCIGPNWQLVGCDLDESTRLCGARTGHAAITGKRVCGHRRLPAGRASRVLAAARSNRGGGLSAERTPSVPS